MSDAEPSQARPTWEQLINGTEVGVGLAVSWPRRPGATPRHVRAWDQPDEWGLSVRNGPLDPAMSWREATGWTAVSATGALAAVHATALLR